jgi:FkbM family methyltransferase
MQRLKLGGLDLSVIDPHERDTRYIYDEVFINQIYYHPEMRMPRHPVVMDVGANIGLFAIWAARRYQPKALYCYEASRATAAYLADNVSRLIDADVTAVRAVNTAVARVGGQRLVLNQSPLVSGISTLLAADKVGWVQGLVTSGEIVRQEVITTTLSAEIAKHGIETVDMLKIDVEGYFLEVLGGIDDRDWSKIRNLVIEVDYCEEVGAGPAEVGAMLAGRGYRTEIDDLTLYAWRT